MFCGYLIKHVRYVLRPKGHFIRPIAIGYVIRPIGYILCQLVYCKKLYKFKFETCKPFYKTHRFDLKAMLLDQ